MASLQGTLRLFAIPGFEGDVRAETSVENEALEIVFISPNFVSIYDNLLTRDKFEDKIIRMNIYQIYPLSPNLWLLKEGQLWLSSVFSPEVVTLVDELAAKEVLAQIHHELTGVAPKKRVSWCGEPQRGTCSKFSGIYYSKLLYLYVQFRIFFFTDSEAWAKSNF